MYRVYKIRFNQKKFKKNFYIFSPDKKLTLKLKIQKKNNKNIKFFLDFLL